MKRIVGFYKNGDRYLKETCPKSYDWRRTY